MYRNYHTDTADGIAGELIAAGLVDQRDSAPVAQNLDRLITERASMKNVVFQLVCISIVLTNFFC